MADIGGSIGGLLQGFNQTYWPAMRQNEAMALQKAQEARAKAMQDFQMQKYAESEALKAGEEQRNRAASGALAQQGLGVKPTIYTPLDGAEAEAAGDFMPKVANPEYETLRNLDPKDVLGLIAQRTQQQKAEEAERKNRALEDLRHRQMLAMAARGQGGGKKVLFMDEDGKQIVPLVPGQDEIPPGWRPYDKKMFGMGDKFKARLEAENENAKLMTKTIDDTLETLETPLAAGRFSDTVAAIDPESPAYQVRAAIKTLQSNIGFDRLQAMREASPTGGALGQVAVQELQALQSTLGNLDPRQKPEILKENLKSIRDKYQKIMGKFNSAGGVAPSGAPAQPRVRVYNPQTGRLE